jgi:hypothetical protein
MGSSIPNVHDLLKTNAASKSCKPSVLKNTDTGYCIYKGKPMALWMSFNIKKNC